MCAWSEIFLKYIYFYTRRVECLLLSFISKSCKDSINYAEVSVWAMDNEKNQNNTLCLSLGVAIHGNSIIMQCVGIQKMTCFGGSSFVHARNVNPLQNKHWMADTLLKMVSKLKYFKTVTLNVTVGGWLLAIKDIQDGIFNFQWNVWPAAMNII